MLVIIPFTPLSILKDKPYTGLASPDSATISFPLPLYTTDFHFRCLSTEITHHAVILKIYNLASIQKVFYSYLDRKPDYGAKLMWAPHLK
jgi:hypothetical protein